MTRSARESSRAPMADIAVASTRCVMSDPRAVPTTNAAAFAGDPAISLTAAPEKTAAQVRIVSGLLAVASRAVR